MSSEYFKSLIVTDPDLVDEGIDVSGLRTTTDTSPFLLGNIPDYSGIQYSTLAPTKYTDLMRLYSQGLPTIDTSQPATPPSGGGGGEGTSPGTGVTTPTQPDSIGGFDPGVTPGPSGFIGLDPEYDVSPFEYDDSQTYEPPASPSTSNPFLASGAAGGANLPSTSPQEGFLSSGAAGGERLPTDTGIMVKDLTQPSNVGDFQITGASPLENQTGIIDNAVEPQAVNTILGPDGITYDAVTGQPIYEDLDAQAAATDVVTEEDLADNTGLLQKLGLPADFDLKQAAIEAGINLVAGVPITLIAKGLEAILPDRDPRQTALDQFYTTGEGAQYLDPSSPNYIPGMENYNIVSGNPLDPNYGLQNAYQKRLETINKTLGKMTLEEYQNTDLVQRKKDIEEAIAKEKAMLDQLQYGDPEKIAAGIQAADDDSGSEMLDTSTPFDADTFDDDVTLTGTPPTGTITPLEDDFESLVEPIEPPMTLADDKLNKMTDDVDLDDFDTTLIDITPNQTVTGIKGPPSEISDDVDLDEFDTTPQTFEADTFDDTVGSNSSQPTTTELIDSDFTAQDKKDIFDRERELENQYMEETGQVPREDQFLGQAIDETVAKKTTTSTSVTPLEDDFESLVDTPSDQDIINRGGGDDISTGGLDPNRGQQVDRGSSGAGDNQPVSTTTGPPSTGFQQQSTYDAELEDDRDVGGGGNDGGNNNGGGKIVCTMMNESYGFGSFRNKIWMKFHKDLSPEYQKGYHKLFLPLVKIAKTNKVVKKVLEHIAVHSTIDMRQATRGKTHLLGRVYRKILLPLCYWVGKNAK